MNLYRCIQDDVTGIFCVGLKVAPNKEVAIKKFKDEIVDEAEKEFTHHYDWNAYKIDKLDGYDFEIKNKEE